MNIPNLVPTDAKWEIKWGNEVIIAPSAFDVLQTIGERSWAPLDHKFPKRGIAYRVFVQYRILIDDELSDELFLNRLAEFGIIELKVSGTPPLDELQMAIDFTESWYNNGEVVKK